MRIKFVINKTENQQRITDLVNEFAAKLDENDFMFITVGNAKRMLDGINIQGISSLVAQNDYGRIALIESLVHAMQEYKCVRYLMLASVAKFIEDKTKGKFSLN